MEPYSFHDYKVKNAQGPGAAGMIYNCLKRSVLLILFGAEEQGVNGSEYYVAHPAVPCCSDQPPSTP